MFKKRIMAAAIAAVPAVVCSAGVPADDPTHVPNANPKAVGINEVTALSPELVQVVRAAGAMPVENPTAGVITHYGYANADAAHPMMPALGSNVEAQKTEPDKNTYLVLADQHGADTGYDYGRRFVYQGHELGANGAITRINLDADVQHRVTALATTEDDGTTPL